MPLYDYTLEVITSGGWSGSGTEYTFEDLGIVDATAVLTAGGSGDKLVLTLEKDARTECPIPAFAIVRLRYQDDLVWQGIRMTATWLASVGASLAHRLRIQCVGPSYFLDSQPFRQTWMIQDDPDHPAIGLATEQQLSAAIIAGDIGSLADMVEQAVTQAADAGRPVSTDTTNIPDFTPVSEQIKDVSCLELVNRMQGWMPGTQCRWNHTSAGGTALLEWYSILRPDNALDLEPSQLDTREVTLAEMEQWSGSERIDLLVSAYTITYLRKRLAVDDDNVIRLVIEVKTDAATAANGSPATKASVVPLSGVAWNGTDFIDGEAFPDFGQASLLLAPFADIYYDVNFRMELDWSWQVLQLINITDAVDGFAAAWANVTSITHSLLNDLTTIEAGPPSGVNLGREIGRPAKTRKEAGDGSGQTFGFDAPDQPNTGTESTPLKVVVITDDTTRNYYKIPAAFQGPAT